MTRSQSIDEYPSMKLQIQCTQYSSRTSFFLGFKKKSGSITKTILNLHQNFIETSRKLHQDFIKQLEGTSIEYGEQLRRLP